MAANTIITSIVTGGTNSHATTSEEANFIATDFATDGVVGAITANVGSGGTGSFAVNADASPDMGVTIKSGSAWITATPSGQNSQRLRVRAAADYTTYTINANASGSTKYDWIYLKVDPTNANNPSADASNVTSIYTSRSSSNTADNGSPPTYGLVLAVITVANGASSITNSNIQDKRTQAAVSQSSTAVQTGWNTLVLPAVSSVTCNGNRSYDITFASTVAPYLTPGMRLRTTRTAAPTQCTSLNGTTQFYSRASASVAGMTFTDDFVVSAWIKITAYSASGDTIASRYNGTSGWNFYLDASGRVILAGYNAGAANISYVQSYQSVPLNKWVHVAAQLDMSTFTATTTTSYVMLDGVDIPCSVARGGTNPTALVQAGNLEIGSYNAGTGPFPGKIAQVAIYNAKVTQANIRATISQGLAGTETSLISAYSFNNSINDLNANANNLTANGSAVATNADSPFGGQADGTISSTLDYAIVTKVATTVATVQVPEGCTIPTTGGVTSVDLSSWKAPYNMPVQRGKWRVETLVLARYNRGSSATTTAFTTNTNITIPVGSWNAQYSLPSYSASSVAGNHTDKFDLATTDATVNSNSRFLTSNYVVNITEVGTYMTSAQVTLDLTTATTYYLNMIQTSATTYTAFGMLCDFSPTQIIAELAHL